MRGVRFALVVAGLAAMGSRAVPASAQDPRGAVSASECCLRLLVPIGARALALGNALAARPMPDALYTNPAGVSGLGIDEFRVHSERTELDKTTTFAAMFGLGNIGTAAISYRLLDYGDIDATNDQGVVTGTMRLTDQLLSATFATTILKHLDAGVSYALYQWRQDCSGYCEEQPFSGTTHAVDLGLRLDAPWVPSLQLGAAVLHLGLPLQVKNAAQRDPAPTRVRVGAAYELLQHVRPDSTVELVASVDLQQGVRAGIEPSAAVGLELILDGSLFLRTGYATGSGKGTGGSVGVGLIWERFDVGVGKSFAAVQDGTEPFQVSFAVRF